MVCPELLKCQVCLGQWQVEHLGDSAGHQSHCCSVIIGASGILGKAGVAELIGVAGVA